jgi:hypothetical protein
MTTKKTRDDVSESLSNAQESAEDPSPINDESIDVSVNPIVFAVAHDHLKNVKSQGEQFHRWQR